MNGAGNAVAQEQGYGLGNTPARVIDKLPIPQKMRQLFEVSDSQQQALTQLYTRLAPLLGPPGPQKPPSTAGSLIARDRPEPSMVDQLDGLRLCLDHNTAAIRELIERLQL